MYEADNYSNPSAIGEADIGQLIGANAPLDAQWTSYQSGAESLAEPSGPAQEAWFNDRMISGTLKDRRGRHRIIAGTYEAAGTSASGHEYAKFDEDFCSEMREKIVRYHPPDAGPELAAYKTMHAENAADSITTYVVPKWKIVRPSRMEKSNRLAAMHAAEMAVIEDAKDTRYVSYDKFRFAAQAQRTLQRQVEESGPIGQVISAVSPFYENAGAVPGPSSRLTQMKCRVERTGAMPYPELAASLLARPSDTLRNFYNRNPDAGRALQEALEEIAAAISEDDMTEREFKTMNTLIRRHLDEAEVNRVFDIRMIQYVRPGDPKHIEAGALKRSYETIHRLVCGETAEIREALRPILFPLAVHMRDRYIPVTVENVIAEGEALLQIREVLAHLSSTGNAHAARGGTRSFLDHASEEELEILNDAGRNVIAMLMPGRSAVSRDVPIYGEEDEDVDRIAKTMFGPRQPGGMSEHPGSSSGGYRQGEAKYIDPVEQRRAPIEREQAQHLTYSPYTEGHDLLRRTRIRKFRPPV